MVERELLPPEILRERLNRQDVREKIKQAISGFTGNVLKKSPKNLSDGSEKILSEKIPSALEKVYPVFSRAVMDFLNQRDVRREMEARGRIIIRNVIIKLNTLQRFVLTAAQYDQTLEEKMPEIIAELAAGVDHILNEENVKKTITGIVFSQLTKMIGEDRKNIYEILDINSNDKQKLDEYLLEKLTIAVDAQIENILTSIDVKTLVSDRIDSLDMKRVERIVLDVLSNQLKWVELFGGVLGFLLGIFQVGITYLLR